MQLPDSNFKIRTAASDPEKKLPLGKRGPVALSPENAAIVYNERTADVLVEHELQGRKIFLNALEKVLAAEGTHIDVSQAYRDIAKHSHGDRHPRIYGSQIVLHFADLPMVDMAQKKSDRFGPPETVTRFGFEYKFLNVEDRQKHIDYDVPNIILDNKPFDLLQRYGVPKEKLEALMEGYAKMAAMADHDYIHHLHLLPSQHTNSDFGPASFSNSLRKHPLPRKLEYHAMATHAALCDHLFREEKPRTDGAGNPVLNADGKPEMIAVGARRKARVMEMAADQMALLSEIESIALASPKNITAEDRAVIIEAVTYNAEIYANRLFRVVSPQDLDLTKPIAGKHGAVRESVTDAAAPLTLQMADSSTAQGLGALKQLTETYLQQTYTDIHQTKTMYYQPGNALPAPVNHLVKAVSGKKKTLAGIMGHELKTALPMMDDSWRERLKKVPVSQDPSASR